MNADIKALIRKAREDGIYQFQIAMEMGMTEGAFSKRLQKNRRKDQKLEISNTIARLLEKQEVRYESAYDHRWLNEGP